jgi:ABC-type antimicrobial peptide transport system permease subunit
MVLRDAAVLAAMGLGLGLAAALAVNRVLRTMLFDVTTTDPLTYVAMALTLGLAVLIASVVPARRASRVDPVIALRRG